MKEFKVKIKFLGLAGEYFSEFFVKARNSRSAYNKALLSVGDRVYLDVIVEAIKK